MTADAPTFATLLKQLRLAAGLTQEALAERAGVSVRNIQALEGAKNQPLKDTARRLAEALDLGERQQMLLAAAVPSPRRRSSILTLPPAQTASDTQMVVPAAPHKLPAALSSLVGRERERAEVRRLLNCARLVTLTGSGGVGKTRLALAAAEDLIEAYPDSVRLVELAALAEPGLVPGAVAQVLGLREEPGRPLVATLTDHLREQRLLLMLDNCEHLVAACAALTSALLRACPGLRILATSREPLEVAGERLYRVPSLGVPDPGYLPLPDLTGSYEAVRLFVARAQERVAGFDLTSQNSRAVAEICTRLDGIPLAIELAAARVGNLGVEGIATRLDDCFRLLAGSGRDVSSRQQTLRGTLDWSYNLLGRDERALLARLTVFAGGWTLSAAEAVCAGSGIAERAVLDLLAALVNKSLAQVDDAGGEARYLLLETVRQYGRERLTAGEAKSARDRHLAWCMALAEEAEPRLRGAEQGRWLALFEAEHDNLRAALAWARERGWGEMGLRLVGAMWRFWSIRGYFGEGRAWLEEALAGGNGGSSAARARALNAAGDLAGEQGDLGREIALQEEGLALWRALGDSPGIAISLNRLAWVTSLQGDYGRAVVLREECLALQRELGVKWDIAYSLNHLGWVAGQQGDLGRALALQEESLALWHALGDRWGVARAKGNMGRVEALLGNFGRAEALHGEARALWHELGDRAGTAATLNHLGWQAGQRGHIGRAVALLEESLALQRQLGDKRGIARALNYLGWLAGRQGAFERASALCDESLQISLATGAKDLLAEGLEVLAWVVAAHGQAHRAARLGGAAQALRDALGVPLLPAARADHDRATSAMREALGEEAFAAAWDAGRAMPPDEVVASAP